MMRTAVRTMIALIAMAPMGFPKSHEDLDPAQQMANQLRKELLRLPNYGVYDYLAYKIDGNTVTLLGATQNESLKNEAGNVVRHVKGVETVSNEIQVLPLSPSDDRIRRALFFRLYREPALSRYAAGGGLVAGDPFVRPPMGFGGLPAYAYEPAGDYAIHILVSNGVVDLVGLVNNTADKQIAGMVANQLPGVFSVRNNLSVENEAQAPPRS